MDARELAQHVYACFGRGDLKGLLDSLSSDVSWELLGPPSIPYFGRYVGRRGVENFFALLSEHEDVLEFIPSTFIAEGENVAVLGHERCRIKQTGRIYYARWAHVFKAEQGLITSWCEYIDTATIAAAYELPPTGPF